MTAALKIDMAEMPAQSPTAPRSSAEARGRYFNSGNAFNVKLSPVPSSIFPCPVDASTAPSTTGFVACDQSSKLGADSASTTPLMLARYATIAPNATLSADLEASDLIWYVIQGSAEAAVAGESFSFGAGDVFTTPGAATTRLKAGVAGALLWLVTNEPLLAFDQLAPRPGGQVVHYPAAEIEAQLRRVVDASQNAATSGIALIFSCARHEAARNIAPMLTLSLNTVPPGEHQRAHRHNAAAITLTLGGAGCYSVVGGQRCDWAPYATLVTPPGEPHSHHNPTAERAVFLIVQDGGLHYHARTMDFEFIEPPAP